MLSRDTQRIIVLNNDPSRQYDEGTVAIDNSTLEPYVFTDGRWVPARSYSQKTRKELKGNLAPFISL